MKEHIQEIYNQGLEKFAGDHEAAKEFTVGFLKEAFNVNWGEVGTEFSRGLGSTAAKGLVGGAAALAIGLGVHGVSSGLSGVANMNRHREFRRVLDQVVSATPLLKSYDRSKVDSFAETIFKFAPKVSTDPNLLGSILAHAVQGEAMDSNIIKTLVDLEAKVTETHKNNLFTPKFYQ